MYAYKILFLNQSHQKNTDEIYFFILCDKTIGKYHIYSYPCTKKYYGKITNNFPGGLVKCVREISLLDERPFAHEFFIRIAQAFPFLNEYTSTTTQIISKITE